MSGPERVLCAAIWVDDGNVYDHQPRNITRGMVFAGWRHHNCFPALTKAFPEGSADPEQRAGRHQGFITTAGRFVDRVEGAAIAYAVGQTRWEKDHGFLTSEDLY